MKTGRGTFYKKTPVIQKTLSPTWNVDFQFEEILMDSTEARRYAGYADRTGHARCARYAWHACCVRYAC